MMMTGDGTRALAPFLPLTASPSSVLPCLPCRALSAQAGVDAGLPKVICGRSIGATAAVHLAANGGGAPFAGSPRTTAAHQPAQPFQPQHADPPPPGMGRDRHQEKDIYRP